MDSNAAEGTVAAEPQAGSQEAQQAGVDQVEQTTEQTEAKQPDPAADAAKAEPQVEQSPEQLAAEAERKAAEDKAAELAALNERMTNTLQSGAEAIVRGHASTQEVVNYVAKEFAALGREVSDIERDVAAAVNLAKRAVMTFPATALIMKYGDKIAVTVTSLDHLDRLTAEHGESSVQVQAEFVPVPEVKS